MLYQNTPPLSTGEFKGVALVTTDTLSAAASDKHEEEINRAPTTKYGPPHDAMAACVVAVPYAVGKPGHKEQP